MSEQMCIVKNRSASQVFYKIPEDGIRRSFRPGESKKIPYSELTKLMWQPGGPEILANFLQVTREVVNDIGLRAEPEYFMSEAQVVELLKNGSYDAFLDALDYAPEGVKELIIKFAIDIPLTDIAKKEAMKKKWGTDIDKMLAHIREEKEENGTAPEIEKAAISTPSGRRTTVNYETATPAATPAPVAETPAASGSKYVIIK